MRQFHIAKAIARELSEKQRGFDEKSMDFWVDNFGAEAASWLVWKHRVQIHKFGAVDFKIPRRIAAPPWFRVAIETLKRRNKQWTVTIIGGLKNPERSYRLRWLRWKDFERKTLVEQ